MQDYVKNQYRRTNKMISHNIPDHTPRTTTTQPPPNDDPNFESLAQRRKSKSLHVGDFPAEEADVQGEKNVPAEEEVGDQVSRTGISDSLILYACNILQIF